MAKYDEQSIKVLKGLDGVRKRPAMYIGDTGEDGYHHLVWEILDNAVDETVAGYCDRIKLEFYPEGHVAVTDNGRGIPVGKHPTEGIPTVDVVMTMLHAGGKFGGADSPFKTSGGLHGVGASVVNALCEWMEVIVQRDGHVWQRKYKDGVPTQKEMEQVKKADKKVTGTRVVFKPYSSVFKGLEFDEKRVNRRLRELAYLNPGLTIDLVWLDGTTEEFHSEGGLVEYVGHLSTKKMVGDVLSFTGKQEQFEVSVAFAYNEGYDENIRSFANNINTVEGGVHLNAMLDSLTKTLISVAEGAGLFKTLGDLRPVKSDVAEGLVLVVSTRIQEPKFGGQTKTRLANEELRKPLGEFFTAELEQAFSKDKKLAKLLAGKVVEAVRSRDAARKARNLSRKKSVLESLSLPGKLSDCSSKLPEDCELYIVEGDSAGGTAVMARNRATQAVLPLRGKVLNVMKTSLNKALSNAEIGALISALGVRVSEREAHIDELRYHKVIIATDADQDGGHILCLLLAFFWKFLRKMIEEGHLYVCDPPLYSVKLGTKTIYLRDDAALVEFREQNEGRKLEVSRFKGLGEMDVHEFAQTAMDIATRNIRRIYIGDEQETEVMLQTLMSDSQADSAARKEFLSKALRFDEE